MEHLKVIRNTTFYKDGHCPSYVCQNALNKAELIRVGRRRGRKPRRFLAGFNKDQRGWHDYQLGQDYFLKLPRALKKKFKKQALADIVEFGSGPLPRLRAVRLREVFCPLKHTLRGDQFVVDYKVIR